MQLLNFLSSVGVSGVLCFAISLRFAHSSLVHKLNSRSKTVTASNGTTTDLSSTPSECNGEQRASKVTTIKPNHLQNEGTQAAIPSYQMRNGLRQKTMSMPDFVEFELGDSDSSTSADEDKRDEKKIDKVYTVGCFDLFHRGHINLLREMRKLGRQVRS